MAHDLLHSDEIRDLVRDAYRDVGGTAGVVAHRFYSEEELEGVPASVIERALGVNNHLRHATIEPGETLLDLGCGAGIDTIIAARRTGDSGKVYALDFLPEMLERTAKGVAEAGLDNVETLLGEMEGIPLPDDSIDHVISNGTINLSPRKARVTAECARVLKPGGKFTASDLSVDQTDLPTEVKTHPAAWAG